jgi:hypothetical protein
VDAYIVMGNPNTRKSSLIRALTGADRGREWDISTNRGVITAHVEVSALQESETQPHEFVDKLITTDIQNVLVPLWIREKRKRSGPDYPNGQAYIQHFVDVGWSINTVVVLGIDALPYNIPVNNVDVNFIGDPRDIPSHEIASHVRELWGWL